jgi:pimeloyl-ACP methyl ester carboxylesterase
MGSKRPSVASGGNGTEAAWSPSMNKQSMLWALASTSIALAACAPARESMTAKGSPPAVASPRPSGATVVLVHGAFAGASSWDSVIPLLEAQGLRAVAVHDPLSSLGADVDTVTRVIDAQSGPVILVGHSWGGTVITQAGVNDKVVALVYVAAFAPSEGQSSNDLTKDYPTPPWTQSVRADSAGFLTLSREAVATYFAPDLPSSLTDVMAATQGPMMGKALDERVTQAAWRTKPSTFVVAKQDQMIPPDLERAMAKKIDARTTEVASSHVAMLVKPDAVADAIILAARSYRGALQ